MARTGKAPKDEMHGRCGHVARTKKALKDEMHGRCEYAELSYINILAVLVMMQSFFSCNKKSGPNATHPCKSTLSTSAHPPAYSMLWHAGILNTTRSVPSNGSNHCSFATEIRPAASHQRSPSCIIYNNSSSSK